MTRNTNYFERVPREAKRRLSGGAYRTMAAVLEHRMGNETIIVVPGQPGCHADERIGQMIGRHSGTAKRHYTEIEASGYMRRVDCHRGTRTFELVSPEFRFGPSPEPTGDEAARPAPHKSAPRPAQKRAAPGTKARPLSSLVDEEETKEERNIVSCRLPDPVAPAEPPPSPQDDATRHEDSPPREPDPNRRGDAQRLLKRFRDVHKFDLILGDDGTTIRPARLPGYSAEQAPLPPEGDMAAARDLKPELLAVLSGGKTPRAAPDPAVPLPPIVEAIRQRRDLGRAASQLARRWRTASSRTVSFFLRGLRVVDPARIVEMIEAAEARGSDPKLYFSRSLTRELAEGANERAAGHPAKSPRSPSSMEMAYLNTSTGDGPPCQVSSR